MRCTGNNSRDFPQVPGSVAVSKFSPSQIAKVTEKYTQEYY